MMNMRIADTRLQMMMMELTVLLVWMRRTFVSLVVAELLLPYLSLSLLYVLCVFLGKLDNINFSVGASEETIKAVGVSLSLSLSLSLYLSLYICVYKNK